jgi:putative DNA primase/helicase
MDPVTTNKAEMACDYVRRGFAIVPIPPNKQTGTPQKGPTGEGWNRPGGYFVDEAQAYRYFEAHPNHNLGLFHGPSGTAALDNDAPEFTQLVLDELGITLPPDAPAIRGDPKRAKQIYKAPESIELSTKKLVWPGQDGGTITVFELRAGYGAQDVLPPSTHPDGYVYEWTTPLNGQLPALPDELAELWVNWDSYKQSLLEICPWHTPQEPKPQPKRTGEGLSVIAAFNKAHAAEVILEQNDYRRKGKRWLAPESKTRIPGVVILSGGKIYSHHGNDVLGDGHAHDTFDLYRLLEHNGDFRTAVRAAALVLGIDYWTRSDNGPSVKVGASGTDGAGDESNPDYESTAGAQ